MAKDILIQDWRDVDLSDVRFPMLVVYDHPRDWPDDVVVRLWDASKDAPMNTISRHSSLWAAKAAIPETFIYLDRFKRDDPVIIGVYI